MAGYCANCGGSLGDNDRVCGNCGTPVGGKAPMNAGAPMGGNGPAPAGRAPMGGNGPAPAGRAPMGMNGQMPGGRAPMGMNGQMPGGMPRAPKAPKAPGAGFDFQKNKNKIIGIAAVAIVAIIVIIVASKLLGGGGYEGAVKKAIKSIEASDIDGMMDVSSHLLIDYCDEINTDLDDVYEEMMEDIMLGMERDCGKIESVDFEVVEANEVPDRTFKKTIDSLEDEYDLDVDDVKEIVEVEVKIICEGKKKTKRYDDLYFICVKEEGGWKTIYGASRDNIESALRMYR